MLKVKLKDGSVIEVEKGTSIIDVAKKISEGLARNATCGEVNGEVKDLRFELEDDCDLVIHTFDSDLEGKKAYWHTSSHIMAQAVKRLFPNVKFAIGPAINEGFYYDFDVEQPFTDEDKAKIEEEMKKIIKEDVKIERFSLSKKDALDLMEDQPYKKELIEELPEGEEISFYKQGDFTDLCAGPHLESTGKVKSIKILSSSGAYWRGDEKNKMLQRIYAISFPKASQLEEYLHLLEEAKKRDHKKLGKELELFMIAPEGPGFPFFLPKGMVIRNVLEDFWRKIGCLTERLSPEEHDALVCRASHLPHIIAATLVYHALGHKPRKLGLLPRICASGFRDTTRVASGSPDMWRDIVLSNRDRIAEELEDYQSTLNRIKKILQEGSAEEIYRFFELARILRNNWLDSKQK